jgi:hypothetical protein
MINYCCSTTAAIDQYVAYIGLTESTWSGSWTLWFVFGTLAVLHKMFCGTVLHKMFCGTSIHKMSTSPPPRGRTKHAYCDLHSLIAVSKTTTSTQLFPSSDLQASLRIRKHHTMIGSKSSSWPESLFGLLLLAHHFKFLFSRCLAYQIANSVLLQPPKDPVLNVPLDSGLGTAKGHFMEKSD